jgi:phosphoglucomutase
VPRLVTAHYEERHDAAMPAERVTFGTSGYRGSAFDRPFNAAHVLATHALSAPAFAGALEVLTAISTEVMTASGWFAARPSGLAGSG